MIEFFSSSFFTTLISFSLLGTAAGEICLLILLIRDFIKKQTW